MAPLRVLLVLVLAASAFAERPEIGVFTQVHGQADVAPGQGGPWSAAVVEAAVLDGDWVRTAKASWAEIALVDGVTLRFDQEEKGALRGAALLRLEQTPEAVRARLKGGELHAETRGQRLVVEGPGGDVVEIQRGERVWLRIVDGKLLSAPSPVEFLEDLTLFENLDSFQEYDTLASMLDADDAEWEALLEEVSDEG